MPEKNRMDYMKEHLFLPWQHLEILGVGPDVKDINVGDIGVTTPDLATSGIHILEGAYLLLRSSNFVAIW